MPNSRIEASNTLNDDQLELLGAWTTNGNNLLGGGGGLLGSNDNFGFFFITNGIERAGFFNTGEFFLADSAFNPNHRAVFKPLRFQTIDELDQVVFSFSMPTDTVYNFNIGVQFRNEDGANWGRLQRSVTANRVGGVVTLSLETFPETERFNAATSNVRWVLSGTTVQLVVNGLSGTSLIWSGLVKYQGVQNT